MTNSTEHPAPHNHSLCINTALTLAAQLCIERGVQLTAIRQQVLELIWADHHAVKAYDLLERIKPLQSAAKPATIYRALDFLMAQGFVHRVESLNAFVGCTDLRSSHEQLLLICKQCENVEERHADSVMQALTQEFALAGFAVHHQAIEIHGICAACTQSNNTPPLN
ncbi:MAG: transcriptional repressor [Methylococcaceae bacterium]|nr:transcriptional repressor [Methylococcaceae bacterium]